MTLEAEVLERSQEISTDAYTMSVGELISLYRDGELEIHPEFQRFFRWTPGQKSRFVESILLGIPIPSLFVSQTKDGNWEVVDGLQRISTLLQLVGELRDQAGGQVPPLRLLETSYLPSLDGRVWASDPPGDEDELPNSARLKIKRARLDLKIVLNTSDPKAKYELFQRLNTGGSFATDQEVRNCVLIMVNSKFFEWLAKLAADKNFRSSVPLSDRYVDEQYDLELLVRFLVLRRLDIDSPKQIPDLGKFLTDRVMGLAEDKAFDYRREARAFRRTFKLLASTLGEDSFKKFDPVKKRTLGPLLISVYEVIALGLGYYMDSPDFEPPVDRLRDIHRGLWKKVKFTSATGSGVSASRRIPSTLALGRKLFAP